MFTACYVSGKESSYDACIPEALYPDFIASSPRGLVPPVAEFEWRQSLGISTCGPVPHLQNVVRPGGSQDHMFESQRSPFGLKSMRKIRC